ncbi:hypothetical protein ABTN81_19730, partial [Acinetobacter baumannii]
MKRRLLFGLFALLPAALGTAPAHATSLNLPLCEGGHAQGHVSIPLGKDQVPGSDKAGCCAKACHGSRKRTNSN